MRIVGPKTLARGTSVFFEPTWPNGEGPVTNYEVHAIKYAERDAVRRTFYWRRPT
jgi:hypothetical protein